MTRLLRFFTPAIVLTALLGFPSAAPADPIVITAGQAVITNAQVEQGTFLIAGSRFSATGTVSDGAFSPAIFCSSSPTAVCAPGATLPIDGLWLGSSVRFTATLDGTSYEGPSADVGSNMLLQFTGHARLPAWTGADAVVVTPFTFMGELSHVPLEGDWFTQPLLGRGSATVLLGPYTPAENLGELWSVRSVTYDFSSADPVPEPATLLLLGAGLLGAAVRRKAGSHA